MILFSIELLIYFTCDIVRGSIEVLCMLFYQNVNLPTVLLSLLNGMLACFTCFTRLHAHMLGMLHEVACLAYFTKSRAWRALKFTSS